jgi:hypothetical protein
MVRLTSAALVAVFALGGNMSAQDPAPQDSQKPRYVSEAMVRRLSGCALPDRTLHAVNTTVTFRGSTYRCVEVLDSNLRPSGVGWTRVPDREQAPPPR